MDQIIMSVLSLDQSLLESIAKFNIDQLLGDFDKD